MAERISQGLGTIFHPFDDDAPTLTDPTRPSAPSDEPPRITLEERAATTERPRYVVRSVLGRGGMGEVRLCKDERIGREIAVKVMLPHVQGAAEARARFIREARIQGQLEHPAIVPVHDVEFLDDGSAYFTMKRVRGQTLSSIVMALATGDEDMQQRFTRRTLLSAFATVCLAIDFAHARGVVHRDLKPQNIMLGDFGEVYVLDWGVAKLVGVPDERPSLGGAVDAPGGASRAGAILGTPGYMAPEQLDAERGPVTPASDVWALGAILFEMLAWQPLLSRDVDDVELIVRTLRGVDARPSVRAPGRAIPAALDAICARALALDPRDRFPSARALWQELDRFLEGEQDVERRRAQSTAHARAAEALLRAAGDDEDDPKRSAAVAEMSRALALDPENGEARRALVHLLTAPPRAVPVEVKARLTAFAQQMETRGARANVPLAAAWLLTLPLAAWAGARDWLAILGVVVPLTLVSVVSLLHSRRPTRWLALVVTALTFVAYIAMSQYLGPFILAPALFATYAVTLQAHPSRLVRNTVLGMALASIAVAFGVEWMSGASYTFGDNQLVIRARAVDVARGQTFVVVLVGTVASLLASCVVVRQVRDMLTDAEEKLLLHAWRLERLVPKERP